MDDPPSDERASAGPLLTSWLVLTLMGLVVVVGLVLLAVAGGG